jgi:hypothetical protein
VKITQAIKVALDHIEEHHYEDRGYDYSVCLACGWNSKEDTVGHNDWGPEPHHRPGCELLAALEVLRKEIVP